MPSGGEFSLIAWIRERSRTSPAVSVGIGDDAAVVRLSDRALVTTDLLMEGVHFDLAGVAPEAVGRKCLAVNLSDIAAMAGVPVAAFVSVALPRRHGRSLAEALYRGMWPLAEEFDVAIAGGDTNTWDGPLVVSVTVLGECRECGPVLRSGARPGDWLLVTGALGGSLSGRHLSFQPRIAEAAELCRRASLHAMIDLSDGLASDLRHIVRESGTGAIIDADRIPIHDDVDPAQPPEIRLKHALGDGEDFELLFAVSPEHGAQLLADPAIGVRLTHIGEITAGTECLLRDKTGIRPMPTGGWEHHLE